jgi:hypothetical protein
MKTLIVAAVGTAALIGATPVSAGSQPQFSMLTTWDSGHSTALDTPMNRVEVGDEMDPTDQPLCDALLEILNGGTVPTRRFDGSDQPVLPSALTSHVWTPMRTPVVAAKTTMKDGSFKTMLEELDSCDQPPRMKGNIPYSCTFAETEIQGSKGYNMHLIRVIMHPKQKTNYRWDADYFLADSGGRIIDKFFSQVGDQFGGGTVFTFKGVDYIAGWSRALYDFSDGYEGKKFRPAKTTFEVASFLNVDGPTALRSCVFALNPSR